MEESEGENENIDENDEHIPTKGAPKHPQRKNLFVNTHLNREGQEIEDKDKIHQNPRSPEQNNKQLADNQYQKKTSDVRSNAIEAQQ